MGSLTPLEIAVIAVLTQQPNVSLNHIQIIKRISYHQHLSFTDVLGVCDKLRAEGILTGYRPRSTRHYRYQLSTSMRAALERLANK
jgi:DNA-binding MarR family transcriptional regulator